MSDGGLLFGVAALVTALAAIVTAVLGRKANRAKAVAEEANAQSLANNTAIGSLQAALTRSDLDKADLRSHVGRLEERLNIERADCAQALSALRDRIKELEAAR